MSPVINGPGVLPPNASPRALLAQAGARIALTVAVPPSQAAQISASGGAIPAPVSGIALIDTGASVTCIDNDLALSLGLRAVGSVSVNTPSGVGIAQTQYLGEVTLPGSAGNLWTLTGAVLAPQGIIALIGTDVLANCVLVYNGSAGAFTLAF